MHTGCITLQSLGVGASGRPARFQGKEGAHVSAHRLWPAWAGVKNGYLKAFCVAGCGAGELPDVLSSVAPAESLFQAFKGLRLEKSGEIPVLDSEGSVLSCVHPWAQEME